MTIEWNLVRAFHLVLRSDGIVVDVIFGSYAFMILSIQRYWVVRGSFFALWFGLAFPVVEAFWVCRAVWSRVFWCILVVSVGYFFSDSSRVLSCQISRIYFRVIMEFSYVEFSGYLGLISIFFLAS